MPLIAACMVLSEQPAGGDQIKQFAIGRFASNDLAKLGVEQVEDIVVVDNVTSGVLELVEVKSFSLLCCFG